jgi:hypothetical protein
MCAAGLGGVLVEQVVDRNHVVAAGREDRGHDARPVAAGAVHPQLLVPDRLKVREHACRSSDLGEGPLVQPPRHYAQSDAADGQGASPSIMTSGGDQTVADGRLV